jgi:TolB-like protein
MAATGCNQQKRDESPPGAAIPCYIDHDMLPGRVQSTSIIPLANDTTYPSVSDGMTTSLYAALLGRQLFNVTVVPPADASTEVGGADPHRSLTLKDLARMRQALGSDVVLIGTVGHFQPYPRMQIGVSLRMVDLRDGRVIWAINHVWDSTDKATQQRIEKYFQRMRGKDYDPIEWRLATVSPATFQEFVAWEMATTLPGPATGDDVVRTPPATGHARL